MTEVVWPGLEVKPTSDGRRGQGVFATEDLAALLLFPILGNPTNAARGTHLWVYTTEEMKSKGRVEAGDVGSGGGEEGVVHFKAAMAMYVNEPLHGSTERVNCMFWGDCLVVTRPVVRGEQLLVGYGQGKTYHRTYQPPASWQTEAYWGKGGDEVADTLPSCSELGRLVAAQYKRIVANH